MSDNRISPERTSKAQREAQGENSPADDRRRGPYDPDSTPRGKLGDARPDERHDSRTRGGLPPEAIEDRPSVSKVQPSDYPAQDRRDGDVTGADPVRRGE